MKGGRGPFSEIGVETAEDEADGITGALPLPARLADLAMLSSVRALLACLFLVVCSVSCCTFCAGCFQALSLPARRMPVFNMYPQCYMYHGGCVIVEIKGLWRAMTMIDSGDLVVCPVGQLQFL